MLIFDFRTIGNRLLAARKRAGLTQAELAERAGLSDRTYADIERGTVNMRMETFLRICAALGASPDSMLTEESPRPLADKGELLSRLDACSAKDVETALALLRVYLDSLERSDGKR